MKDNIESVNNQDEPAFYVAGKVTSQIEVKISYRIIDLFSQGLYTSPNKAIEELVANSFDAGATSVHVILPPDFKEQGAAITVIDNGTGMNEDGLRQHWLIGVSSKRDAGFHPPKGRKQIGRFGIGKLATYVLSDHLTHICKSNGKFYATTMDFTKIPHGDQDGIYSKEEVKIPLRELTEDEAQQAVQQLFTDDSKPGYKAIKLFGKNSEKSWTVAVMSGLKEMATEIQRGKLRWILETAMPLRDDFHLFLDGDQIEPSKLQAKKLKSWTLGKEIKELSKPGPTGDELQVTSDNRASKKSFHHFGFTHSQLGRITGYAELYDEALTGGKSANTGFSNGFFVYVRGRLVNTTDEYFGIDSNLLRHGTFARFRLVVHIDRLDEDLRSSRESVREGTFVEIARNFLHGVFNYVRNYHEKLESEESPGTIASRRIASAPRSLSRNPILNLLNLSLNGKYRPRYFSVPSNLEEKQIKRIINEFEKASEEKEGFISSVELADDFSQNMGIAVFDVENRKIRINALHPYVAHFLDEYDHRVKNTPLELLAIAEVHLEAHLLELGVEEGVLKDILIMRDELLRDISRRSPRRNAHHVAQALLDAATNKDNLEIELVASFNSIGFSDAVRIGGAGKPDGIAVAYLAASENKTSRQYRITLEAKSKEKRDGKVAAGTVKVSTLARHRKDYSADYSVVVGPDFPTSQGDTSALSKELANDREKNPGKGITLIRIADMARLVRLVPAKRVGLDKLRDLFETCSMPEDSKAWIDKLAAETTTKPPYKELLETIADEQKEAQEAPVEFASIVTILRREKHTKLDKEEIIALCNSLAKMVPEYVTVRQASVEINQRPDKILKAISAVIGNYPSEEKKNITI
jgi:Histidine kinase-, DNA gyrase B-, and HSP90-like ATPase